MAEVVASAENYAITVDSGRATVTIWRRRDLDFATGARNAEDIVSHLVALTSDRVRSIVFDVRDTPPAAGPRTQSALEGLLRHCERKQVPIAFIVGDDAVRVLQLRRLVAAAAPRHGRAVREPSEAEAFLDSRSPARR